MNNHISLRVSHLEGLIGQILSYINMFSAGPGIGLGSDSNNPYARSGGYGSGGGHDAPDGSGPGGSHGGSGPSGGQCGSSP